MACASVLCDTQPSQGTQVLVRTARTHDPLRSLIISPGCCDFCDCDSVELSLEQVIGCCVRPSWHSFLCYCLTVSAVVIASAAQSSRVKLFSGTFRGGPRPRNHHCQWCSCPPLSQVLNSNCCLMCGPVWLRCPGWCLRARDGWCNLLRCSSDDSPLPDPLPAVSGLRRPLFVATPQVIHRSHYFVVAI